MRKIIKTVMRDRLEFDASETKKKLLFIYPVHRKRYHHTGYTQQYQHYRHFLRFNYTETMATFLLQKLYYYIIFNSFANEAGIYCIVHICHSGHRFDAVT